MRFAKETKETMIIWEEKKKKKKQIPNTLSCGAIEKENV